MTEAARAKTRAAKAAELADLLKAEEAKPWKTRVDETMSKVKKIIPNFPGRSMCIVCKRDMDKDMDLIRSVPRLFGKIQKEMYG
jgi:hypothetical protein